MSDLIVELVADAGAMIGEGPVWNHRDATLDWVDITGQLLHRFSPQSGIDQTIAVGRDIGAFAHRRDGGYVLALQGCFALMDAGRDDWRILAEVDRDAPEVRMNDGKCDRRGRFWAGTIAYDAEQGRGVLYRLDPDGSITTVLRDLTVSNGLAWSSDDRTLYFIDSFARGVDAYDFDLEAGALSNRRQLVAVEWDEASPAGLTVADGMTVDAEDHLWVAIFGKGEVRRYSPDGALVQAIDVPVPGVTSCAFGGEDFADLYITSSINLVDSLDNRPGAGGLFRCRPGVAGRSAFLFAG
jgi:sugar lactone lactonase YvrE